MHLNKQQQKQLKKLEADPLTRWRITKASWKNLQLYGRFISAAEQAICLTSTGDAPWTIVDGSNERYRALTVAQSLHQSIVSGLKVATSLDKDTFNERLLRRQGELNLLQRRAADRGVSTILVFEGWDAAGKGSAIRRVTPTLEARHYQVIQIAAPTDEERAHH